MPTCLNCQHTVTADARFCHHCGAKIVRNRLTLWAFFVQLGQIVFNTDSSIWLTFRHLCYAPGRVCRGYIEGIRKRYLMPIAYLFSIASLYALAIFLTGGDIHYFHEDFALGFTSGSEASGLSEEERTRILRPLSLKFILLSIPIQSLISRLVYWKTGYNFAEHLVINAYYIGQLMVFNLVFNLFALSFPILDNSPLFNAVFTVIFLGYAWLLQVQTFQLKRFRAVLLPLLFLVIMLMSTGLFYGLSAEFLLEASMKDS